MGGFAGMTPFGFFHTAVSILAIPLGAYAYLRGGRINPHDAIGKAYLLTMLIGSVTALFIYHHGGFGPGHVLSIVTMFFLALAYAADRVPVFGRSAPYVQAISFDLTYFLLMFFTTTESLTRLPVEKPFASAPDDPRLTPVRAVMLLILVVGAGYQVFKLRAAARRELTA